MERVWLDLTRRCEPREEREGNAKRCVWVKPLHFFAIFAPSR
jgi:hypothetical protein